MKVCAVKGTPYPFGGGGSENNVYSTEEQVVGTWIDGKPLYRRTFQFKTPSTASTTFTSIANTEIQDIENIVSWNGGINTSNGYKIPIEHVDSGAQTSILYDSGRHGLRVFTKHAEYTNSDMFLTIEYTKTTDTAAVQRSTPVATATYGETTPEVAYQELANGNDTPTEI